MKRPPRPRPLAQRTIAAPFPRTVRDRGALALRAAPRLRGIGSLAVTPDLPQDSKTPVAIIAAPVETVSPVATLPLPAVPIATPPVAPAVPPDAMTLRGGYWEICYQERKGVVADCRGLRYIALLVRDTGEGRDPIHAKELAALAGGKASGAVELEMEDVVLDTKARKQLMNRLEELACERDRAVAVEDFARATKLDDEYEQIADELGRAGATRGSSKRKTAFVHTGEKARKAVAKAIAEAIARIADHPDLAPLAAHLTSALRKGQWLSYRGGSDWQIDFSTPLPRK